MAFWGDPVGRVTRSARKYVTVSSYKRKYVHESRTFNCESTSYVQIYLLDTKAAPKPKRPVTYSETILSRNGLGHIARPDQCQG